MRVLGLVLVVLALVLHLVVRTNAAPQYQKPSETGTQTRANATAAPPATSSSGCGRRAADIARTATEACGSLPVEEVLRSVAMPAAGARRASEALAALGFETALDLELRGGGDVAAVQLWEVKMQKPALSARPQEHLAKKR